MTMMTVVRTVGLMVAMGAGTAAVAQHQTFHVNPARSLVQFAFQNGQGKDSGINGTLLVAKTAIEFDKTGPATGGPGSHTMGGSIIARSGTERTGNRDRDKAIKTQVLMAPQFAEIVFEPKSFTGSVDVSDGSSTVQVTGTLTLNGVAHEVTAPVEFKSTGNACTVKAHLVVPYVQWGLKDLSGLNIQAGPQVAVDVTLVGYLTPEN
jgi:polyisoprenoid-binding protein YceI